jgi:hypothetical protein
MLAAKGSTNLVSALLLVGIITVTAVGSTYITSVYYEGQTGSSAKTIFESAATSTLRVKVSVTSLVTSLITDSASTFTVTTTLTDRTTIISRVAATVTNSSTSFNPSVNNGTLLVACMNCSGGQVGSSQFIGDFGSTGNSRSIDGNGTASYTMARGSDSVWIVSWMFGKSTVDGILSVKFILDNGTMMYNKNTTTSYGAVSGLFVYSLP